MSDTVLQDSLNRSPDYALLTWFNLIPVIRSKKEVVGIQDLTDGYFVWEALQAIDPSHFIGDLGQPPGTGKWVPNLINQKQIHKALIKYLLETFKKTELPEEFGDLDPHAIAQGDNHAATTQQLLWVFVVMSEANNNEKYMEAAQELTVPSQSRIMDLLVPFQKSYEDDINDFSSQPLTVSSRKIPADDEFRKEELAGILAAENTKLTKNTRDQHKEITDLTKRLQVALELNGVLRTELGDAQDKIKKSSSDISDTLRVKDLQVRLDNSEEHIAYLEGQVADYKKGEESLTLENQKLHKETDNIQPLRDEVDMLKKERDTLVKKNNALERIKTKVQNAQEVELENKRLRSELEETKLLSEGGDVHKLKNLTLQREVMELKSLVSNTEIQLVEAQARGRQMYYELTEYRQSLEAANEQRQRDRDTITQLTEQSPNFGQGLGTSAEGLSRELEFEEGNTMFEPSSAEQDVWRDLTSSHSNSEPSSHNARLVNDLSQSHEREKTLQKMLDAERTKSDDLQKRYMTAYTAKMVLEATIKNQDSTEGSSMVPRAYYPATDLKHSKLYRETTSDLKKKEEEAEELQREMRMLRINRSEAESASERDPPIQILAKNADKRSTVALIDKDKLEIMEKLKVLNNTHIQEQKEMIETLESDNKALSVQLKEHQIMLSQALMNQKDNIADPELDSIIKQKERDIHNNIRKLSVDLQEGAQKQAQTEKALPPQALIKEIESLKSQMQQAAEKAAPELMKASVQAALKQENDNIRRENKLMATAFYDLSSRLQMNNVSLQRRSEAPRSFLNKQRALVNQATAVRAK